MISIVIQAGGKSSRMGSDKGLVQLCGQPLIKHVIDRIGILGDEILITTNHPENYEQFGLPMYADEIKDFGALAGLFTALKAARFETVIVAACDMPFVSGDLFRFMLSKRQQLNADLVIPKTANGFEPFHAVYKKNNCYMAVKHAVEKGNRRMISWFEVVTVIPILPVDYLEIVSGFDPFMNINTQEELKLAQEHCR